MQSSYVEEEREGFDADHEADESDDAGKWLPRLPAVVSQRDVPLGDFPRGAHAGTLLHAVFEKSDFCWAHPDSGPEGPERLREVIDDLLSVHGFDVVRWGDTLQSSMLAVLRTPLGGRLRSTRLCDIPLSERFNEFRFDVPLAGGNLAKQGVVVASDQIVKALKLRKQAPDSRADEEIIRKAWLDGLGKLDSIAGFMTGSMDLVFRHEVDGIRQWFVVDYKSNRLDPYKTGRCPTEHFSQDFMRYAMEQNSYYLQYHIYLLALHRYIRLRTKGEPYDYGRDMGGACYLFIRGMTGESTPVDAAGRRFGCFHDKPPKKVIDALDGVLADPSNGGGK